MEIFLALGWSIVLESYAKGADSLLLAAHQGRWSKGVNVSKLFSEEGIQLEIFGLAARLEPNDLAIWTWYYKEPIGQLGDQTAAVLVRQGRGRAVVEFLSGIIETEDLVRSI